MEQSVRDVVRLSSRYVLVKKLKGGCSSLFGIHHDQVVGSSVHLGIHLAHDGNRKANGRENAENIIGCGDRFLDSFPVQMVAYRLFS